MLFRDFREKVQQNEAEENILRLNDRINEVVIIN